MLPVNTTFNLFHSVKTSGTEQHDASAYASNVPALLMPESSDILALEESGAPASQLWSARFAPDPGLKIGDKLVESADATKSYIVTGIRYSRGLRLPNVRATVRQKWGT